MWTFLTLTKRRARSCTKRSGLPVAPIRRVVLLRRSSLSQRLQTREQASRLSFESRHRKISTISSSGRTVLIQSWPRIVLGWTFNLFVADIWERNSLASERSRNKYRRGKPEEGLYRWRIGGVGGLAGEGNEWFTIIPLVSVDNCHASHVSTCLRLVTFYLKIQFLFL